MGTAKKLNKQPPPKSCLHHPRYNKLSAAEIASARFAITGAQLVVAHEHGFASWPEFADHIAALLCKNETPYAAFIDAACAPLEADYTTGTLDAAKTLPGARISRLRCGIGCLWLDHLSGCHP